MEDNNLIIKAVNYIEDNLHDELTLDEIAHNVGYSKFHLNRLFSEIVGYTLHKYIQRRRLTEAAKKLVYTDRPIVEIACEANYNSQQSFTLAFRQLYICTPQLYRIKGIYNPKQSRFIMKESFTMFHRFNLKHEVAA